MVRCITIDDEPLALEILKKYIRTLPDFELVNEFSKPIEAFYFLTENKIDLIFIDIKMPELSGLNIVKLINNPPQIIFTTAFREFALEGFEVQALDYLLKPISYERFLKAINKYQLFIGNAVKGENQVSKNSGFIFIKVDKEMIKLSFDEIYFVEALKNYVKIRTINKYVITYHTLSYMEDKLPSQIFQRIHKSYLINLHKVEKYTLNSVFLQGKEFPVGKTYLELFLKRIRQNSI